MINLRDRIYGYFGREYATTASGVDGTGKGTLQRFVEMLADDFDTNIDPLLENLFENLLLPFGVLDRYLPDREEGVGNHALFLTGGLPVRKKILAYMHRWYEIKGTVFGYTHALRLMGLIGTIEEGYNTYSFDSPITFDDGDRRFDQHCLSCSTYCLNVSRADLTTDPLQNDEIAAIMAVVAFNHPINTVFEGIKFNAALVDAAEFSLDFNLDFTS